MQSGFAIVTIGRTMHAIARLDGRVNDLDERDATTVASTQIPLLVSASVLAFCEQPGPLSVR